MSDFPTGCFFGADELEIPSVAEQDKRRRRHRSPASSGRRKKRRTANESDQEDSDNDDQNPTNPTTGTHDNVVCCAIYCDKNILGFCTYDDDRSKLLVSSTEIDTNNLSQPKYQSHIKRALTLYVENTNPNFIVLSSQVDSFIHDVCLSLFSENKNAGAFVPEQQVAITSSSDFNVIKSVRTVIEFCGHHTSTGAASNASLCACGGLMQYLIKHQVLIPPGQGSAKPEQPPLKFSITTTADHVLIDHMSLSALGVFAVDRHPNQYGSQRSKEGFSLSALLCKYCRTSAAKKLVRKWLRRPTNDRATLNYRYVSETDKSQFVFPLSRTCTNSKYTTTNFSPVPYFLLPRFIFSLPQCVFHSGTNTITNLSPVPFFCSLRFIFSSQDTIDVFLSTFAQRDIVDHMLSEIKSIKMITASIKRLKHYSMASMELHNVRDWKQIWSFCRQAKNLRAFANTILNKSTGRQQQHQFSNSSFHRIASIPKGIDHVLNTIEHTLDFRLSVDYDRVYPRRNLNSNLDQFRQIQDGLGGFLEQVAEDVIQHDIHLPSTADFYQTQQTLREQGESEGAEMIHVSILEEIDFDITVCYKPQIGYTTVIENVRESQILFCKHYLNGLKFVSAGGQHESLVVCAC